MKRSDLEALGLSKEAIDSVMDMNGKDIENAKSVGKGDIEAKQAEIDNLTKMVSDRDKSINQLKESAGMTDELKAQIETLQSENREKDKAHKAEVHALKVDAAVEAALSASKAKNVTAVKALLKDLDKAQFGDDGKIIGLSEQITALQTGEDTKFLFSEEQAPNITGVTPADGGDPKPSGITKEQFSKMSYNERVELYNTNKEAYDALIGQE